MSPSTRAAYGRELAQRDEDDEPKPPPIEPDLGLSGRASAAETNTVNGVTLVYRAAGGEETDGGWRLYVFKNGERRATH